MGARPLACPIPPTEFTLLLPRCSRFLWGSFGRLSSRRPLGARRRPNTKRPTKRACRSSSWKGLCPTEKVPEHAACVAMQTGL